MQTNRFLCSVAFAALATLAAASICSADVWLGDAPAAPKDVSALPEVPSGQGVTGRFPVGADAITAYIWDFGANNDIVGHRRWLLYPQTKVMGTGDVPNQGGFAAANATWVFDANYGGPRPATRKPFVSWPPAGYVPYQVVYPQWSFALSNVN